MPSNSHHPGQWWQPLVAGSPHIHVQSYPAWAAWPARWGPPMSLEPPGHLRVTSLVCGGCQVWLHASKYILVIASLSGKSFNLFLSRSSKMSGVSSISPELQFSERDVQSLLYIVIRMLCQCCGFTQKTEFIIHDLYCFVSCLVDGCRCWSIHCVCSQNIGSADCYLASEVSQSVHPLSIKRKPCILASVSGSLNISVQIIK